MVRLAVNWETRLRGNKQREGAFSSSCWMCVLWRGGHRVCRSSSSGGDGTMDANVASFLNETAVGEKFLFALAKAVGPVCGVDRVSSSGMLQGR
jgi:hypothetical protein